MRTSCLLLVGLGGAVISLSTPGCGGKLTDAETRYYWDSAAPTGMTSGSGGSTTGADGDNTGGAGGDNTGGTGGDNTGGTGSGDPNPTGAGGASGSSGTTGTGGTTGSGGTTGTGGTGSGTGGSGPAGSGGGGGGPVVDASVGCPESQPMNNATCDQVASCNYGTTSCSCAMAGGGNQRDGGRMTWTCRGVGGTGGGSGRG